MTAALEIVGWVLLGCVALAVSAALVGLAVWWTVARRAGVTVRELYRLQDRR